MKTNYWTLLLAGIGWGIFLGFFYINPTLLQDTFVADDLPNRFTELFPQHQQNIRAFISFIIISLSTITSSIGLAIAILKAKKEKFSFLGALLNFILLLWCCLLLFLIYFGTAGLE